jgi:hypothetical protein
VLARALDAAAVARVRAGRSVMVQGGTAPLAISFA